MMATAPQAESPTTNSKLNNCDSNSSGNSSKLVNGLNSEAHHHNNQNHHGHHQLPYHNPHPHHSPHHLAPDHSSSGENNNHGNVMKSQDSQQQNNRGPPHPHQQHPSYNNSYENHHQQQQIHHRMNSEGGGGSASISNSNKGMSDPNSNNAGGPGGGSGPDQGHYPPQQPHPHQQPQYQQYPPYRYDQQPPPQQPPQHNSAPPPPDHPGYGQHPGYPPPMRFPGKPMPGGGPGGGTYPVGRGGYPGQSISQPAGPTPTLNQLLQSSGGANPGNSPRYPTPGPPPGSYDPHNPYSKAEYNQGPTGWPPPSPRPPLSSYAHPPPPPFQQQQPLYRQSGPGGPGSRSGSGSTGGPPASSPGGPAPPGGPGQQHPGQPYYQGGPPGHGGYPPPPPQSPHYPPPPHPAQPRYPSPGPGMRPPDNQPSHYPGQLPPGMGPEQSNSSSSGLGSSSGVGGGPPPPSSSSSSSDHPPKSTPPPPPSPSHMGNHGGQPPSPQQSPRSTPHPPPVNSTASNSSNSSCPPPSSPSQHRPQGGPQGSSPSNNYPPPPDVGEVTGCNSNDSVGGANSSSGGPGGVRPSPSPTGSASSRSMSPAVGNQNIPMPPRPSSQSEGPNSNAPRMSQSPLSTAQGGSYPGQPPMAPPPHHHNMYGGKGHPGIPQGPPPPGHYPGQQQPGPPPHWQNQPGGPPPGPGGYPRHPGPPSQHAGSMMGSPYPPPPGGIPPSQQPLPGNSYPPPPPGQRHPIPNHVPGQPGQGQYPPYPSQQQQYPPPPQPGQQQGWPPGGPGNGPTGGATPPPPPGPPSHNSRSQSHYLKHHLQQKLGYGQQQQGGYPMGPPQSSSGSPSQTPPPGHPPHHPPPPDITENSSSNNSNPPNIVSVGPDGANVDEGSQASTISNASGASGGDDGPSMPKLRPEGRGNYPSTPQSNAVPSPGAASMGSAQEDYDMNSPGWPRTPASPGINSHPPPPSEHYRGKNKKADSLNKLYDMDDNPDRRMFLDKLIHFMEDQHNPITSCPTISKNPLDLFRLYFLVKERGGFLEVTNKKTWKDIAGSLGIGASSSAAYTLRKHYTKHLLPFECKFDRGGIDPQPLINQTETTGKKKGKGVAPVPSPGSSNSQDSFPGPNNNTNSSSMDGFSSPTSSNYPSNYPPSGPGGEYPTPNSSTPSPLARPNQQTSQNPSQQHPGGDKSQVSVSNPFEDTPPANTQYPYQQPANRLNYHYPPYSSQPPPPPPPSAGYQGPPGSYPYGAPEGYSTRGGPPHPPPGMPSHEGPYTGQGYPPPQGPPGGPGGYTGQPSRPMYPPYGEGPPQNSGVPPGSSANSGSQSPYHAGPGNPPTGQPPASQGGPSVPPTSSQSSINSEESSSRYNSMAPPATNSYSPGRGQYPPPQGAQGGPPHAPPPNGYPGQDYYHSQSQTEQGYPGMGQGPGSAPPTTGKHMPPPHPNQAMRYPPGKDAPSTAGPGPYPGYPSQSQSGGPPRVPSAYGGPYGPYSSASGAGGSGSVVGRDVRSSPSPSPVTPTPPPQSSASAPPPTAASPHSSSTPQSSTKPPWIPPPPEGWPGSGGPHYQGQRPGNYVGAPPGGPVALPPSGASSTPTPSQSPGVPVSAGPPPSSQPSPQAWGSGRVGGPPTGGVPQWAQPQQPQGPQGPPSGSQGQTEQTAGAGGPPGRYGPSGGSMMSPPPSSSNSSSNQPPWTTPPSSRSGGRPAFPGKPGATPPSSGSSDMYKGYGSPAVQPPSVPPGVPPSVGSPGIMKGPAGQLQQPPPGYHPGQPHHPHQQQQILSPQIAPPQVKKEITFPPDSVEAVTPVFTRRKKLHKNDVAPVEAWRIMMCLKSGLLAETTWALDVLNVLLYDDHSISYFSLTYLPGLLDILLEHLRRALILMFGQSIGIEIVDTKEESLKPPPEKCGKWDDEDKEFVSDEPDIGMPVRKFPRDCQRTLVLQGTTNYTMVSRVSRKTVGIVAKDEEPFVVPGPRDWDWDEKCRQNETEEIEQLTGTMDVTKHIVTYFSSDLKNVPVVRDLKEESKVANCVEKSLEIKVEKTDEEELDLKMYQCETKIGKELILSSNPGTPKVEMKFPVPIAANPPTSPPQLTLPEKKNCVIGSIIPPPASGTPINFSKANLSNKKGRRLDDVLGRLRKDVVIEEDNAMSESPAIIASGANSESSSNIELPQTDSDSVTNSTVNTLAPPSVLENGGGESSSNMSMEDTGACPTPVGGNGLLMDDIDNTCDSTRNERASPRVVQVGELCIKDPACTLKRKRMEDLEDECYTRDESSLYLVSESQDSLARRCLSICNIIRNLTFVPGNDIEFGKCVPFLSLIGKLILLHHEHPVKSRLKLEKKKEEESESDVVIDEGEDGLLAATLVDIDADSCTSLSNEDEWWWDYVHHLREHVLVMIANISGQMDLSQFSEEISRPILDGLLHWAVCPAAYGQDPFPTLSPGASLSPQRLAIEALCKLSVIQGNVDLLLATPPYSRIERLAQLLCRSLCRTEEQVLREFSLNLLFYLSAADSGVARTIALQNPCISLLISFIEQAENNAMNIASTHGFAVLRENPEAMGTSLDMLRRAAMTLLNLARHPDNRPLFVQHEPRLLQLVMSQILEQKVAAMVAQVLFQCSTPAEGPNSQKYFYSSANTETFYTPLFSRSRSAQQQQQSHIL